MSQPVKIAIYVVLIVASIAFGRGFYSEYKAGGQDPRGYLEKELAGDDEEEGDTNTVSAVTTNPPAGETNLGTTTTNLTETNLEPEPTTSNEIAAVSTNLPPQEAEKAKKVSNKGKMIAYLGLFLGTAICLGLFVAHDISHYMGTKALKVIYNDDLEGMKDPEYEEAEQAWANGKYLEAIQLMRDYLKKNPREQHVALRIAEIYEKNLNNPLAAALEYEEVLKYRLPDERWGWAAIHLSNLYSGKLNRETDAIALLKRIDAEYPNTGAAKKARERLGKPESAAITIEEPPASAPTSNLPKGFRPKK